MNTKNIFLLAVVSLCCGFAYSEFTQSETESDLEVKDNDRAKRYVCAPQGLVNITVLYLCIHDMSCMYMYDCQANFSNVVLPQFIIDSKLIL